MRRWRTLRITGAALAASVGLALLTGCAASTAHAGGHASAPADQAAGRVLSRAIAAVRGATTVHIEVRVTTGPTSVTYSDDAAGGFGEQAIAASNGGTATVLEVKGVGYFKANVPGMVGFLGLSATDAKKFAGQWISFQPGDVGYQRVVSGVTLGSVADELALGGRVRSLGARHVVGQAVIGLQGGTPPVWSARMGGTATLYVAAGDMPLPVTFRATTDGGGASAAFSRWGEPIHVMPPGQTIPSSSVLS